MINEDHYLMAQTNTFTAHTYRAVANQYANYLAKLGAEHTDDLVFVMDILIVMKEVVLRDSLNIKQVLD
ncbi:hypothetical protein RHMOL_Rhmol02G0012900 [Rhododendron molle]|nr:hypothetical protein RHMOL_Rhmol02G0012900 [Rhododendron molle]